MNLNFSFYAIFRGSFYAFFLGVFFGIVYDLVRLIRILLGTVYHKKMIKGPFSRRSERIANEISSFKQKHQIYRKIIRWFDVILDFLFCLFCGICYSVFLYAVNYGIFRFIFIFATVLGVYLYRKTIGCLFFCLLQEIAAVFFLLAKIIRCILSFLLIKPIKWSCLCIFFPFYRKILLLFHKKHDIINRKKEH